MRPTARDSARVSLWACLLGGGSLSWHVRPGPPVLHVRATRTGLPRTVRTQRRRAACPQGPTCCTYWVRVPASGVPCLPRSMVSTAGTSGDGAVNEPGPNPHPHPEPKPKPNPGSTWRLCSIRTFASKYGTSAGRCALDLTLTQTLTLSLTLSLIPTLTQTSIRPYWRCYYQNTNAVIYVVDSADQVRVRVRRTSSTQPAASP